MSKKKEKFRKLAATITNWAGSPIACISAILSILLWLMIGPAMKFSSEWQLWCNTGTTVITYLVVFFIQNSQNRDSKAVQVKLNGIIAAMKGASNRLIDLESNAEEVIEEFSKEIKSLKE